MAAAAVSAADELEDIRQLAGMLQGLTMTLIQHAARGDAVHFAATAELLLPLHAQFAQVYRTWMVTRTAVVGRPPFIPLGGPDSMSV